MSSGAIGAIDSGGESASRRRRWCGRVVGRGRSRGDAWIVERLGAVALVAVAVAACRRRRREGQAGRAGEAAPAAAQRQLRRAVRSGISKSARTTAPTPAAGHRRGWPGLIADLRARNVNDLVTVHVVESIVGTGTADSSLDKNSSGAASA